MCTDWLPKAKLALSWALWAFPVLFAPAIGPVLSGWLVEYHSWRWIFLINIPIGIIAVLIDCASCRMRRRIACLAWISSVWFLDRWLLLR
ncbi:MFS transporter [Paenibacillus rhizoplanae]